MKKLNIFFYDRDSRGNQANINKHCDILTKYTKKVFGEANITVYIDKCGLSQECRALEKLIEDLKEQDVDWVITPNSNRFYRINYKDGKDKLLNILNKINKKGTNIAFAEELIQLSNQSDIENYVMTLS